MNVIRTVWRGSLVWASLASAYGQAATLHFYRLQASTFAIEQADLLARNYNLSPVGSTGGPTGIYQMGDGSVRLAFKGGQFHFAPDIRSLTDAPPTASQLQRVGSAFLQKYGFVPKGVTIQAGPSYLWGKCDGSVKNGDGKPVDLLRTQTYFQLLDGVPVLGPNSILSITGDAGGIAGAEDTLVPAVQVTNLEVVPKSASQLDREYQMKARMHNGSGKYSLKGRRLVYFEQGGTFIQPAYMYDTEFIDDAGLKTGDSIVVPLARNSPEAVRADVGTTNIPPIHPDSASTGSAELERLDEMFASTAITQSSPVYVGQYIVREDHPCWLTDAQSFWSSVNTGRTLTPWHPSIVRRDYWWDYPWCWETALGVPDNSPYFVNQDHFVQIEGHGAPWEITTYKDYGDIIDLTKIAGYGKNRLSGKTAWCVWQSCDVIPVPGDAFGGLYSSGSPFDVWWGIFKGMRGNFGYHTTMGICNGVGNIFGFQAGLGLPLVSSWLNCTASNPQGHPSGWNYGSAVIVSGHEGDTFYDTSGVANPGSLTMWWIHA